MLFIRCNNEDHLVILGLRSGSVGVQMTGQANSRLEGSLALWTKDGGDSWGSAQVDIETITI